MIWLSCPRPPVRASGSARGGTPGEPETALMEERATEERATEEERVATAPASPAPAGLHDWYYWWSCYDSMQRELAATTSRTSDLLQ